MVKTVLSIRKWQVVAPVSNAVKKATRVVNVPIHPKIGNRSADSVTTATKKDTWAEIVLSRKKNDNRETAVAVSHLFVTTATKKDTRAEIVLNREKHNQKDRRITHQQVRDLIGRKLIQIVGQLQIIMTIGLLKITMRNYR